MINNVYPEMCQALYICSFTDNFALGDKIRLIGQLHKEEMTDLDNSIDSEKPLPKCTEFQNLAAKVTGLENKVMSQANEKLSKKNQIYSKKNICQVSSTLSHEKVKKPKKNAKGKICFACDSTFHLQKKCPYRKK